MKNKKMLKPKDFSIAMERLKVFSKNEVYKIQLEAVKDRTFFRLFSRKVTGEELNERLAIIQNHFIYVNESLINIVREFYQVYHTFEALDKEYIQAILISQNEIEKTSESIKNEQAKIKKLTEDQNRILKGLKKFQEKIDSYSHLKDIDDLWTARQLHSDKLVALEKNYEKTNEAISQNKMLSDEAIIDLAQKNEIAAQMLAKKIRYIYIIAVTSLSLAVIQLLYLVVRQYVG